MTRKALGRGLNALLKDSGISPENEIRDIDVDLLEPNQYQPRQMFAEAKLDELAQSIKLHGFVQPIVARRSGQRYQIVAGERRWRAAQRLGLSRVPVLVREVSDVELVEASLIENIQRENLNPIEEALAYQRLAQEFGLTQEQVAQRTGKERSTVTNFLRLLKLPKEIQQMVLEEQLSMGHARALLGLDNLSQQRRLAEESLRKAWSVRQLERRVSGQKKKPADSVRPRGLDPNVKAAVEKLERALGTRVRIVERGSRGRIEIEFYSREELQRLYQQLLR